MAEQHGIMSANKPSMGDISGLRRKLEEPLPLRDMTKEDYLALPEKTASN
jgi:hypothetical protein